MMLAVHMWNYMEALRPSQAVVYGLSTLLMGCASGALIWALFYIRQHPHYTHWVDVVGMLGALVSGMAYTGYSLALWLDALVIAVPLFPLFLFNVGVAAGLILLARLVVMQNKNMQEMEMLNSVLLYMIENFPHEPDRDGITHSSRPVSPVGDNHQEL